jgi:hypothetical protein
LNAHTESEGKTDDSKNSFYEELEHVFNHFPRYQTKILLRNFDVKLGKEDILKPKIGNERLHQGRLRIGTGGGPL